ncbi:MAG: hypothetical protein JXN60_08615 [Lentisphaerae bacterium]|nr:hypothetical protein [Lentisphaerota bacterium]
MGNRQVILSAIMTGVLAWTSCAVTVSEVWESLRNHGIPFDSDKVMEAAVHGALSALDPSARIVTTEDLDSLFVGDVMVCCEKWAEGICYVKLGGMFPNGGGQLSGKLRELLPDCETGLIVDLRGSGGTDLACMDEIARILLRGGTAHYKVKHGTNTTIHTIGVLSGDNIAPECMEYFLPHMPLVIVIDAATVGASEVLAAILKGRSYTVLVGMPTSDGLNLRGIVPLPAGEMLYMVTHQVVLTDGLGALAGGVDPDIFVSCDKSGTVVRTPDKFDPRRRELSDQALRDRELMIRVSGDPALSRTVDMLLGLRALSGIRQAENAVLSDVNYGNDKE